MRSHPKKQPEPLQKKYGAFSYLKHSFFRPSQILSQPYVQCKYICGIRQGIYWADRILSWPHTGFNVHSLVRAKTKPEAERVGKYMLRPILALERLTLLEAEGKVGYRYGEKGAELETMDYLEFIARTTSHIPDKGQVTVRYYGLYANAHRGKVLKAAISPLMPRMIEELRRVPSKGWAAMIRKVYEVDPMICPKCGGTMKVVAFITEHAVVDRIIDHLKLTFVAEKPPPSRVMTEVALMAAEESGRYFMD